MTNSYIKILLLGEYSIFRSALRMFIEAEKRLKVVGEAADSDKAAEIMAIEKPDLVLVDLADHGGRDLLPFLQTVKVPVIILIGKHDVDIYQKCLKSGISGLVQKEESGETLFKAIEKVHHGEIWFDRTIMGETIRQLLDEKQSLHDNPKAHVTNSLTLREKEVVGLICKGMKNKAIAEHLFITETTVRHHLTSVFNKLEITSRLELVVYAFKNNLVGPPECNGSHNGNGHSNGSNGFLGTSMS
jgi:DNA-binding NarL/FixJ family response regulator